MTVTSSVARNDYLGNGGVALYAFTFETYDVDGFTVSTTATGGPTLTLARGADYTVALNTTTRTGTITLTAGALANGVTLAIVDNQKLTQLVDLEASNKYPPSTIEAALDLVSFQLRTLQEEIRHCVRIPNAENLDGLTPSLATRAGKSLGFDSNGAVSLGASLGVVALPLSVANGGTGAVSPSGWASSRRLAVRAVGDANISISAPGPSMDALTLAAGDRVLLIAQTLERQNGIWVWNGAAVAMTRPADYPTAGVIQAFTDMEIPVLIGGQQYSGTAWGCTTTGGIVIDATSTAWALRGIRYLNFTAFFDPPSLADGAGATTTFAVNGAVLGDFVRASFALDLQGIIVTAWVNANGSCAARFQNETGGTIDLDGGTILFRVEKP